MALSFLVTAAFLLPAAQNGLPTTHLSPPEQARSMAAVAACDLERSYALRNLAVIAEEQGDLDKAARLVAESLTIRRRIGGEVYLGDSTGVKAIRKELPEQARAARTALPEPKLAGNGDR
jgi:hypothetical protein